MGFYSTVIFPRVLDWFMARGPLTPYRRRLLAEARGKVLEIGLGTGVNLAHYPPHVCKVTAVDPNPGMHLLARKRIQASAIPVEYRVLKAEALPMADESFDTVVSTMTMCSIADLAQALRELHRVLKPDGRLLFLEHGLSPDTAVQVWQHRLTPITRALGDGCHLNRNIQQLIEEHPFKIVTLDRFYLEDAPKIAGSIYMGIAEKA